jgi:hypothetical protein
MLNDIPPSNYAVTSRNNLVTAMLELRANGLTWQQIADRYCITKAMAYRIANQDYNPVDPEIRQSLGLDAPTLSPEIIEARLHWVLDLCEVTHA